MRSARVRTFRRVIGATDEPDRDAPCRRCLPGPPQPSAADHRQGQRRRGGCRIEHGAGVRPDRGLDGGSLLGDLQPARSVGGLRRIVAPSSPGRPSPRQGARAAGRDHRRRGGRAARPGEQGRGTRRARCRGRRLGAATRRRTADRPGAEQAVARQRSLRLARPGRRRRGSRPDGQFPTADTAEAVNAFLEKRQPRFEGR